jgi:hypothetical protein
VSGPARQRANTTARFRGAREWFQDHDPFIAIGLFAVTAAALVLMAHGLPARTFFVGDPGVKLIAARNAIEHPAHPFDIDVPRIGTERADFLDPFFPVHGDHAHATTSELFPLMSAPLIVAFGIRGAFVLPAIGFLLAIAAVAGVGVALDERRSWTMMLFVAAACTPFLFYALEFWEHAPAVGVAACATLLVVRKRSTPSLVACGLLFGLAILLRPEAAEYCAALLFAARWLTPRFTVRQAAVVLIGVAVVGLPFGIASAVHSGHVVGGHVAITMSGITQGWWSRRMAMFDLWFVPRNNAWLLGGALLSLAVGAATEHAIGSKTVSVVGSVLIAVVAVAAARRVFEPANLWNAAPAALLLFRMPALRVRHGQKVLLGVALVSFVLVGLTAPNDGGGQWGPRYLLFAFIPVAILMADALASAMWELPIVGALMVCVVVVSSLLVQRNAYKDLQAAKRAYERIVEFVEREIPVGSYVVTDLWWLDQVTAALYPGRVMLFVDAPESAQRAFRLLAKAPNVFVVRSESESPRDSFEQWREGTPFAMRRRSDIPERELTIFQMSNRP